MNNETAVLNLQGMKVGEQFTLRGSAINNLQFSRVKEVEVGLDEEPRTAYVFRFGKLGFTIFNAEDAEILKTRKGRASVIELTLERNEYQREVIDPDTELPKRDEEGNPVLETVASLTYVGMTTTEDAVGRINAEASIAKANHEAYSWRKPSSAAIAEAKALLAEEAKIPASVAAQVAKPAVATPAVELQPIDEIGG